MDNVTHTLAGLAVAHAALYLRGRRRAERAQEPSASAAAPASRFASLLISALANNAPDLDFLYRGITPGRLGYLLHHRGHTHTLLATLPLGLLCLAIVAALLRLRGQRLPRTDWGFLLGLALFGGVLHVTLDFGNSYGVHPLWPLDDHWYYGDAIFIVEPWLLIALAGSVFGASRSRTARALSGLILVLLSSVAWGVAYGPSPSLRPGLAALLTLGAGGWLAWMGGCSPGWRRASGLAALGLVLTAQLSGRALARAEVRRALSGNDGFALASLVSTPLPGNPLCWSLLAVGHSGATGPLANRDEYVVQQALVSAWPAVWPPSACSLPSAGTTAPLAPPARPLPVVPGVLWGREFRAPLAQLQALAERDCVARGFLRFARVPFWIQGPERARLIGDLRFDRSPAIEFAELPLEPGARCPPFEPPWRPPLRLIDPAVP